MLGYVNKLFVFKSLLKMPSNVLPMKLKQTFLPIIWIFAEGVGDRIEFRLPLKIFSTLKIKVYLCMYFFPNNSMSFMIFLTPLHDMYWMISKLDFEVHEHFVDIFCLAKFPWPIRMIVIAGKIYVQIWLLWSIVGWWVVSCFLCLSV